MAKVKHENAEHLAGKTFNGKPWPKRVFIYCPGCYEAARKEEPDAERSTLMLMALHCINVESVHQWNGDVDKPTFNPSLLAIRGEYRCHSFVRDGMMEFLSDCTHPLAGQTVELLDAPGE